MLDFIKSIQLLSSTTLRHNLVFNKENVPKGEVNVAFSLKSELIDKIDKKSKRVKLRFLSSASAKSPENEAIMDFELVTEYLFKIVDGPAFWEQSEETRIKYCSNIAYLDFRGKLSKSFFDIGMQGFELPMSPEQLSEDH